MKKILTAAFALFSLTGLVSCLDGGGNEYHATMFYHAVTALPIVEYEAYADQTEDSVKLLSYDSWEARLTTETGKNWLEFSPDKVNIPAGYFSVANIVLKMSVNTTGIERTTYLQAVPATSEIGPATIAIRQYGWLNISRPIGTLDQERHAIFATELAATDTKALLAFYVHGETTVTSDASWLTIPEDCQTLQPGDHGLLLPCTANNGSSSRVAHVTLTSNGVSTTVTYTQKGK